PAQASRHRAPFVLRESQGEGGRNAHRPGQEVPRDRQGHPASERHEVRPFARDARLQDSPARRGQTGAETAHPRSPRPSSRHVGHTGHGALAATRRIAMPESLEKEIARRRTFAIISHPDAGKTTLTEKLLLYGGAIHLAGSVKQRRR